MEEDEDDVFVDMVSGTSLVGRREIKREGTKVEGALFLALNEGARGNLLDNEI